MKNLFSVGEVAKQQNISKQTLSYYDKIGLFSPAYVDPDTAGLSGYHSHHEADRIFTEGNQRTYEKLHYG